MDFGRGGRQKIYGVVPAIVVDNEDPEGRYRVQVMYPWVRTKDSNYNADVDKTDQLSNWARVVTQGSGNFKSDGKQDSKARGWVMLPEVGDEVLVMFEQGNVERPYVIGTLYNGVDLPPYGDKAPEDVTDPSTGGGALSIKDRAKDNKAQSGKNNLRYYHSRAGHLLMFDDDADDKERKIVLRTEHGNTIVLNDKDGKERITIWTGKGKQWVLLDEANKLIEVKNLEGNIEFYAPKGTFKIEAKDIDFKTEKTVKMESGTTWNAKSGSTMDIEGGGTMTQKAPKIDLNP